MDRRAFLKWTGMGSVAFAAGCNSHPERNLFSLVRAPEDMVTGEAAWYASTCRECPSGCGVLAKNREGRVVKLEGNPLHPINQGKLCARGHAALQGLYHPDRIHEPLLKEKGGWKKISFDQALALIQKRAYQASVAGPDRVAMLTGVVGDHLLGFFKSVLSSHRSQGPLIYEPFAYESLKYAHQQLFDRAELPGYRLDQADMILGFGADFLETWLSPVEYSRKFKTMHAWDSGQKGFYAHVGTYQSLTAANADQWIMCRPGGAAFVAMGLIAALLDQGAGRTLPGSFRTALMELSARYRSGKMEEQSGVTAEILQALAKRLMAAKRPLVLPTAATTQGAASAAADMATVLLNAILDPAFERYDFDQRHRVEIANTRAEMNAFWQKMTDSPANLLLLNNVNPLYSLPDAGQVQKVLSDERCFVVAFATILDETAVDADLIMPVQHPLESWGAYESKQGMVATLQPALGKITEAPNIGDVFLSLLPAEKRPFGDYRKDLAQELVRKHGLSNTAQWLQLVQNGGRFVAGRPASKPAPHLDAEPVGQMAKLLERVKVEERDKLTVEVMPSLRFFDGRHADRPWLPEIPDPISQVSWQTLAMVHPEQMAANGWADGQSIRIATAYGEIALQAVSYAGIHPSVVVVPTGQGHTQMGRYARNQGANPVVLLGPSTDPITGAPDYAASVERLETMGGRIPLAIVSGSTNQLDRKIALSVPLKAASQPEQLGPGLAMDDFPFTLPLPEGYDHSRDIYPAHDHEGYRWGMTVDLDRCIGCSACVAGCYAENNLGMVGEERIIEGREMAWIRIERYQDPQDPDRMIFLPMMCQHCDNAPCESVCPVYAPHHSKEGLNNQIYNRCIGTRFCAQNCPYKVRRFNWFDWKWPEPLNLQLNPDVTVRSKGVMEKCSFCVQRIKAAHNQAKNEKRDIRDGEVVPACVQTCPTDALVFGNLMDPNSAVRKKIEDPRAYQVMGYLNTKPAVIYLKKVIQEI